MDRFLKIQSEVTQASKGSKTVLSQRPLLNMSHILENLFHSQMYQDIWGQKEFCRCSFAFASLPHLLNI
jgi:hypothetical protein